jgi:phosphate ABC transporter phosphate-binding protein
MWNFEKPGETRLLLTTRNNQLLLMPKIKTISRFTSTWAACKFVIFGLLFSLSMRTAQAQTASDLNQAKRLFVEPLQGGAGASALQASLAKRLQKSARFEVVNSAGAADAIVRGTGELWVRGYLTTNSRSPSKNRQPVYGGYLSIEVIGRDNETLWSYLVTPSKFSWGSITDDLSDQLVKQLTEARHARGQTPAAPGEGQSMAETTLHGAGATFPAPLYRKWFESFQQRNPSVQISYDPVGSEAGVRSLAQNKVDFAASDVLVSQLTGFDAPAGVRQFASVLGAVVPIYNLPGLSRDLKFSPETLAGIYLGQITKWNDPRLKSSNKGANLPDSDIVVIHRSDGSGTTYAWSDFLSAVSPGWKATVGRGTTLNWPIGTGAEHNEGVAAAVQHTPNSIGYVELVHAIQHQQSFGAVRNRAGEYVRADLSSLNAATKATAGTVDSGVAVSIINAAGKGAYPIATFTWLLLPQEFADAKKKAALLEFLRWMLTSGQRECSALGYAPLPHDVVRQQLESLNNLP